MHRCGYQGHVEIKSMVEQRAVIMVALMELLHVRSIYNYEMSILAST